MSEMKLRVKIVKNGPYLVFGSIPLTEKIIVPRGRGYIWRAGRPLSQSERYALCRCGKTKHPPFCDGAHVGAGFNGEETASRLPYAERCGVLTGPSLDLLDDNRCAFARFCHRDRGDAWSLALNSDDPSLRAEAIRAAGDCPAGRLTAREKSGEIIEPVYEPAIEIIQDPERQVSGGILVKGKIPVESSNGQTYEPRSSVVLCRCGHSRNMPFCDASHVTTGFFVK